jgi:hypothetical protein
VTAARYIKEKLETRPWLSRPRTAPSTSNAWSPPSTRAAATTSNATKATPTTRSSNAASPPSKTPPNSTQRNAPPASTASPAGRTTAATWLPRSRIRRCSLAVKLPIEELLGPQGHLHCAGYRLLQIDGDLDAARAHLKEWVKANRRGSRVGKSSRCIPNHLNGNERARHGLRTRLLARRSVRAVRCPAQHRRHLPEPRGHAPGGAVRSRTRPGQVQRRGEDAAVRGTAS